MITLYSTFSHNLWILLTIWLEIKSYAIFNEIHRQILNYVLNEPSKNYKV